MTWLWLWMALVAASVDTDIIGQPAQPLGQLTWLTGEPTSLEALRGRVVLVRWWTAPHCPFCKASSVALNDWHKRLEDDGLSIIGLYHHKTSAAFDADDVRTYATALGFRFPIAVDRRWNTLERWWLDGGDRSFTSVSFLIDRQGVVRHVHPGGDYVKGDGEYEAMDQAIRELLAEDGNAQAASRAQPGTRQDCYAPCLSPSAPTP
ncbi:MAG: TlpA disulfide reductase family protein [Pseudomonadota bacterium]